MNDLAWMIENDVMHYGGLLDADIASVNHQLRRAINSPHEFQAPVELVRERAAGRSDVCPCDP